MRKSIFHEGGYKKYIGIGKYKERRKAAIILLNLIKFQAGTH